MSRRGLVEMNELKLVQHHGSGEGGHHLFGNISTRLGKKGACAACGKTLAVVAKCRSCRLCEVVVHNKCAGSCPANCAASSAQHSDEVLGSDATSEVRLPTTARRGHVAVTTPSGPASEEKLFSVVGDDAVWFFERDPGEKAATPVQGVSLAGATVEAGKGRVVTVRQQGAWHLELHDEVAAKEWGEAISKAAEAATERMFRPLAWKNLPQVEGAILDVSEKPLLERVMQRDPSVAKAVPVIDADEVQLALGMCVLNATGAVAKQDKHHKQNPLFFVSAYVLAGGQVICEPCVTTAVSSNSKREVAWNEWATLASDISHLHGDVVLLFLLHGGAEVLHVHAPLCDEGGRIIMGQRTLHWWKGELSKFQFDMGVPPLQHECGHLTLWIGPPTPPPAPVVFVSSGQLALLTNLQPLLEYEEEAIPFTTRRATATAVRSDSGAFASRASRGVLMQQADDFSPIVVPAKEECVLRWATRDATDPRSVCKALLACNYSDPVQRKEAIEFCREVEQKQTRLPRYLAHFLLLHIQSSSYVRAFAMRQIYAWNSPMILVSLALVSILTFSPHDCNGSLVVLLQSLSSKRRVEMAGEVSSIAWVLHALAQKDNSMAGRFDLYWRVLLSLLRKQVATSIAGDASFSDAINELSRDDQRRKMPLNELAHQAKHLAVLSMGPHTLSLDSKTQLGPIDLKHSKALPSNAAPLMLRFPVAGDPGAAVRTVIWKAGDDLATDELVVTMGLAMNMIWQSSGCEARIVTYGVRATGERVGSIEMVPGCTSLGKIQGNWKGALFKKTVISDWLHKQPGNSDRWEAVRKTFLSTLAGAVVFEYVMGLGDRHCDNLLLKPTGEIFHIDFGCSFGRDFGVAQGREKKTFHIFAHFFF